MFFALLMIIFLLSSIFYVTNDVYADSGKDSKFLKKICKAYYWIYLKIGEDQFREKFWYKRYLQSCIDMYSDPDKHFSGKAKIYSQYSKR